MNSGLILNESGNHIKFKNKIYYVIIILFRQSQYLPREVKCYAFKALRFIHGHGCWPVTAQ